MITENISTDGKKVAAVVRSIYISAVGKDGGGSVSRKNFTGDKAGLSGT